MLEKDIQSIIIEALKRFGCRVWKNNAGRQSKYSSGPKGSPDIIGYTRSGKFIGVEVKRPGEYPTDVQKQFLADIQSTGGISFVARGIDDVIDNMKNCG